jgi:drug/metabolite transporter (DMT)-like permease
MLGAAVFNAANICRHLAVGDIAYYFAPYCNLENMVGFVFLAIVSTIIATSMNNYAMSKIQLSTASAFGGVSTLVTVLIGLACGEKLFSFHLIGFSLILIRMIGVSYISIRNSKKTNA